MRGVRDFGFASASRFRVLRFRVQGLVLFFFSGPLSRESQQTNLESFRV